MSLPPFSTPKWRFDLMSQRLTRVRELIQRELGDMIQKDITFPNSLVSIHGVDLTPDLRHCHVFIGVLGGPGSERRAMEILQKARGLLQSKLASRVVLKFTPKLHFKLDSSVERGVRTVNLLEQLEVDGILPPVDPSALPEDYEFDDEDDSGK